MDALNKKPKKKPSKVEEMSKEQIRQAILKKRECNAKAQAIVESLLEKSVTEEFFIKCLPDINQNHFEDVIEERSILHLCGYPLCHKTLSEKDIPKQKYRISLKTNKVYDITARKNFCTNGCYKSAMHIKKQMLTSPLWFREYEVVPDISLLPMDSLGSLGQEIDLKLTEQIAVRQDTHIYTSINDFTDASLNEISGNELLINEGINQEIIGSDHENTVNSDRGELMNSVTKNIKSNKATYSSISFDNEQKHTTDSQIQDVVSQLNHNIPVTFKEKPKNPIQNPLSIVGDIIEKPERKIDPILINQPDTEIIQKAMNACIKNPKKKLLSITAITIEVEKCLAEWFTLDTLLFLFGDEKLKKMVTDKGDCIQEYLSNYAKSVFYTSNTYDQYQALCRKLNMLELEDRKHDAQTPQRETKPLPDYSILQEESKTMQLKVKAFLAGETEIPEPEYKVEKIIGIEIENPTQLPLIDKNAQNALRRRIVWQHLNKVLPDLLRSLNLSSLTVSADIQLLVNTFKLQAHNIMFKPIQWTLITIVFIKLLSIRDKRLEYLLQQPMAFRHLQLLLLSYKQDEGYLDRLISWLTDIDRMLDLNDTQLTIE